MKPFVLVALQVAFLVLPALADDAVEEVVKLNDPDLTESSGLAASHVRDSFWWTHNDSGGKARLFAFKPDGTPSGRCQLNGVDAVDWEDMASFTDEQQARLVVADCGDNFAKRESIQLYLFNEPDPKFSTKLEDFQQLEVTYVDGPHNCEAIAVDVAARKIILITKENLLAAGVYLLDLPRATDASRQKVVAKRITSLAIPMISAVDRNASNGDLWVINYFQAFHFARSPDDQTLAEQLGKLPVVIDLPKWKQIEAVAVDDAQQVWITSEGQSAPLGRIAPNQ